MLFTLNAFLSTHIFFISATRSSMIYFSGALSQCAQISVQRVSWTRLFCCLESFLE